MYRHPAVHHIAFSKKENDMRKHLNHASGHASGHHVHGHLATGDDATFGHASGNSDLDHANHANHANDGHPGGS
jgi:hypothetical protein